MNKFFSLLAGASCAAGILLSSTAVYAASPMADKTGFFLDTVVTISLYDTDDSSILDKCFEDLAYYESIFSRTVEGSDVWNINHANGESVTVSDDTIDILNAAIRYSELSDGAFDVTIEPVSSLWDFHQAEDAAVASGAGNAEDADDTEENEVSYIIPDDAEIQAGLTHIDYTCIHIDGSTVTLTDPDAGIDLGAIAKGYISDRLKDRILAEGSQSALINLGGNVLAVGSKPDGSDFGIGVRRPFGDSSNYLLQKVMVSDRSVITSGTYERFFEVDGVIYHHILDTATGYPVNNGLTSVSILSDLGTDGDALSTTCFLLGSEKGMELIESLENVEALFIDEDGTQTASSGWTGSPL